MDDIFNWMLVNGDVLNGAVLVRIFFMALSVELLGIVSSVLGQLGKVR